MAVNKKGKKKASKKQLKISWGTLDDRVYKILGILCFFFAFYLTIAFVSYLTTWKTDQNEVLGNSFSYIMSSEIQVDNWLGRLGALVSHTFFYWLFGAASFLTIPTLLYTGNALIKRKPIKTYFRTFGKIAFATLFFAILLAFIFRDTEFPIGGAVGNSVVGWLRSFVGTFGVIMLFFFMAVGYIVWSIDPNFNEMTYDSFKYDLNNYFSNLFSFKKIRNKVPTRTVKKPAIANTETSIPANSPLETLRPTAASGFEEKGQQGTSQPKTLEPGINFIPEEDGQLEFELEKIKKAQPKPIKVGEAELEIAAPSDPGTKPGLAIQSETLGHSEPYDPTQDLSTYEHPPLELLLDYSEAKFEIDRTELEQNKDQIIATLLNYKIEIIKIKATIGPTVTLYEIVPAPGVRISKIKNLEDDIALSLSALGIRIIAPIPGKGTIGIEVPNKNKQIVSLKEVLHSDKFAKAKMDLPIGLGKTISNEVFVADLAKMPHLLIAGATGQGKSVGINCVLMSLLYKKHPSQIKLILIDPKKVELFPYSKLAKHFLATIPGIEEPIVTDTKKVVTTLHSLSIEMDQRYDLMKQAHARNIREYNEKFVARKLNPLKGHRFMPFLILVIDEFADLIMTAGKEIELPIGRLAQLSRAVGIHLIIATQRPSVNIITGVIKANFPARLAYRVTSKVDSRTIIDTGGADRLIGRGDMLLSFGSDLIRLQCAFIDTPELERAIDFISEQRGYAGPYLLPEFHSDDDSAGGLGQVTFKDVDEMFEDAARLVVQNQHGSTSMIQRRLRLGYNRAGRIMDQMEAFGFVGPSSGSKAREVLVFDEVELERLLEDLRNRK